MLLSNLTNPLPQKGLIICHALVAMRRSGLRKHPTRSALADLVRLHRSMNHRATTSRP
jgi:hypothetical protein